MPEGDTIHRAAARLQLALQHRSVVRVEAWRVAGAKPVAGEVVRDVEAVGKQLLMHFSGGLTIETHMKMTGSWHLYRPGERWQKPRDWARALVEVDEWVAVCFSAPVVRIVPIERSGPDHLGPDLCREGVDFVDVVSRARMIADPGDEIADVLLDQRVAAGIGNVYKSEVLWALRVSPFARLDSVDDETLSALYKRASVLLRANLHTNARTTVKEGLAVYGRRNRPCRRCGVTIRQVSQGRHARVTTWCERCQPSA